jgi:hypothetical protein
MATDQHRSIIDYLQTKTIFNDDNFRIIREQYRQECGGSFPTSLNESAADQVVEHLNITIDTEESLQLLYDCFSSAEINNSQFLVKKKLANILQLPTNANSGMMKLFYRLDKCARIFNINFAHDL